MARYHSRYLCRDSFTTSGMSKDRPVLPSCSSPALPTQPRARRRRRTPDRWKSTSAAACSSIPCSGGQRALPVGRQQRPGPAQRADRGPVASNGTRLVIPLFSAATYQSFRQSPGIAQQTVCCRPQAVTLCASATNPQAGALPYTFSATPAAPRPCASMPMASNTPTPRAASADRPASAWRRRTVGTVTDNETIPAPPCTPNAYVTYGGCSTAGSGGWGVLWENIYNSCGQLTNQGWFGPSCYTSPPCNPNWQYICGVCSGSCQNWGTQTCYWHDYNGCYADTGYSYPSCYNSTSCGGGSCTPVQLQANSGCTGGVYIPGAAGCGPGCNIGYSTWSYWGEGYPGGCLDGPYYPNGWYTEPPAAGGATNIISFYCL